MKPKRLIELANLDVDHELTPAEARDLEAELHANPGSRRIHHQYRRMQKACELLFEASHAKAPSTPRLSRALADAGCKIDALNTRRARPRRYSGAPPSTIASWRNIFALGGLATATACVALLLVLREPSPAPQAQQTSQLPAAPATPQPPAPAAPAGSLDLAGAILSPAPAAQPAPALQTPRKRFRLPVITSFASAPPPDTAPAITAPPLADDNALVWAGGLQMRPLRKITIEEAMLDISSRRNLETPPVRAPLLPIPATGAQEDTEWTIIEFKR